MHVYKTTRKYLECIEKCKCVIKYICLPLPSASYRANRSSLASSSSERNIRVRGLVAMVAEPYIKGSLNPKQQIISLCIDAATATMNNLLPVATTIIFTSRPMEVSIYDIILQPPISHQPNACVLAFTWGSGLCMYVSSKSKSNIKGEKMCLCLCKWGI